MDGGSQEGGPGVDYVLQHPDLLNKLFKGYALVSCIPQVRLPFPYQHGDIQVGDDEPMNLCVCRYDNPAIALNCGSMLRDCVRSEVLAK